MGKGGADLVTTFGVKWTQEVIVTSNVVGLIKGSLPNGPVVKER